jgi:hypothetical protein
MRVMMDRVRTQERIIMKLCVEQCKMPKKNFITLFTGNETSETWFNAAIAMNKPWSEKLHDVKEDVHRGLQKLQQIEEETGLTIEQVKISTVVCLSVKRKPAVRKKRWLKRTYVWLSLSPRNTPTVVCNSWILFRKATSV